MYCNWVSKVSAFLILFILSSSCSEYSNDNESKLEELPLYESEIGSYTKVLEERLPEREDKSYIPVLKRNQLEIQVDFDDKIRVRGELVQLEMIKDKVIEFYDHPIDNTNLPILTYVTIEKSLFEIDKYNNLLVQYPSNENYIDSLKLWNSFLTVCNEIGSYNQISKEAILTIQLDNKTTFKTYTAVLNEIILGLNYVRNELSLERFHISFHKLNDDIDEEKEMIKIIKQVYPKRIMKAKSRNVAAE